MNPRRTRARWAVPLLFAGLGTAAYGSFQPGPVPPHRPQERPPELRVTLQTEGPAFCREGQWVLSASVEGGTPERVELLTNGETTLTLEAPYRHVVDCATHVEGRFAFVVRAISGKRGFDAEEVSVTVDRTPPTLVATRPSHSYPSVSSPIAFVFSEPLLPDSLQPEATQLQDFYDGRSLSIAHHAILREDNTVLELVPASPLQLPVRLMGQILQRSLTDRAGNPIDPNLPEYGLMHYATYWSFSRATAPALPEEPGNWNMWLSGFTLDYSGAAATPVVGVTHYRTLYDREVTIKRWDGHTWQQLPPLQAVNAPSAPISEFRVASRDGALVAYWSEYDAASEGSEIHFARFTGTDWQSIPSPYSASSGYSLITTTLAQQGRPVVAVRRQIATNETEVRVIRWTGTEWQPLGEPLSENSAPSTPAERVAIAAADTRVVVSWEESTRNFDPPHSYIHIRAFELGSQVPVRSSIPVRAYSSVEAITLAIQPDRRVLMAWTERGTWIDTGEGPIYGIPNVIRFSSASMDAQQPDWPPPESIEFDSFSKFASLRLVAGQDLEPWLIWSEHRNYGPFSRSYYRRLRATGWEPKQPVADESLYGFLLDEEGIPWALIGDTIVRPQ